VLGGALRGVPAHAWPSGGVLKLEAAGLLLHACAAKSITQRTMCSGKHLGY